MTWHRNLANRVTSALVGTLTRHGRERRPVRLPRLLRPRARARPHRARLQLRPGAHPVALGGSASSPSRCRSPTAGATSGRSFVRYPEYLARVAPAVWREWRASRATRRSATAADRAGERERPGARRCEVGQQRGRAARTARPAGRPRARRRRAARRRRPRRRAASVSAPSTTPVLGACRSPSATSGIASGSAGEQVPRREPEAEHGGGEEGRHEQLDAEHERAEAAGELDLADVGQRAREVVAVEAPEPPDAHEGEREERRPAQQAVLAVDEQGHEPVGAVGVAAGEGGVGGGLAGVVGGVGGGAAVDRLVDRHVEDHAEERDLDGDPTASTCAARAPEAADGDERRSPRPAGTNLVPSQGSEPSRAKQRNASRRRGRSSSRSASRAAPASAAPAVSSG